MSLTYWYDHEPFFGFPDLGRLFDAAWEARSPGREVQRRDEPQGLSGSWHPRMDLHESKDKNEVTAAFELPGLQKEDVSIDVHNNRLVVSGQGTAAESLEQDGYTIRERRSGRFSRAVPLPIGTKPEEIKATMENGVLKVKFPRVHPEQQAKRVTIS